MNLSAIGLAAAALAATVVAAPSGWFVRGLVFDNFERPAIIETATDKANDAATIRIMDAANRAEAAERDRMQRASAEALRIYREALDTSERAAAEAQTRMEQEIAAYETELALQGRSCPVTQRDLDWVRGLSSPSGPDSGR